MPLSLEEITEELISDDRPNGADGCSNVDRIRYVLSVFECESINLNEEYDWSRAVFCPEYEMVLSAKHLALLQFDLFHRAYYNRHLTLDEFNVKAAVLTLGIQKINWHLDHMERGLRTPPFPSIH